MRTAGEGEGKEDKKDEDEEELGYDKYVTERTSTQQARVCGSELRRRGKCQLYAIDGVSSSKNYLPRCLPSFPTQASKRACRDVTTTFSSV